MKENKFEEYQYNYLERLIKFYAKDSVANDIKIKWLSGMMKQQFYDDTQKKFLNKMVQKYNTRKK
tara:strand:- start:171 stop:365 length:195 start_codon:yes stop_codon:yes gene_type:complete